MSKFRLSNNIFSLGLDTKELSIYAYLCSLPSVQDMLDGKATVKVKQSTIAEKCCIKAVQTVARVIRCLKEKGLVEPIERSTKSNHHKGTYTYAVTKQPTEKEYFFVDRHVLGTLNPRQMTVYLFLCKAYNNVLCDSWNSYNDLAAQLRMKRETVIQTISELTELKAIVRMRRKSRENRRVYVDNHYQIIFYIPGRIRKGKKKVRAHCNYDRTQDLVKPLKVQDYDSTYCQKSQEVFRNFCFQRGSPEIYTHIEYPISYYTWKRKNTS